MVADTCKYANNALYRLSSEFRFHGNVHSQGPVLKFFGMDSAEDSTSNIAVIRANVPLAEMLRYTIELRGMTSGKAAFEMQFSHYDPISGRIADNAAHKKQLEDEANK